MRILDEVTNKSLKNVTIYLTYEEALEFRHAIGGLLKTPLNNHAHISSENFKKEITLSIYDIKDLKGFSERSIDLILNDQ